jgi:hypothetical protein
VKSLRLLCAPKDPRYYQPVLELDMVPLTLTDSTDQPNNLVPIHGQQSLPRESRSDHSSHITPRLHGTVQLGSSSDLVALHLRRAGEIFYPDHTWSPTSSQNDLPDQRCGSRRPNHPAPPRLYPSGYMQSFSGCRCRRTTTAMPDQMHESLIP